MWSDVCVPAVRPWSKGRAGWHHYHHYFIISFYARISCQTLTKYPSVSWIIEIFDCKFGQESDIVKSNFMITQSCKLLQVDTFHSKQPIDFLSAKWMQTRRICVWQMTADNICLMLPSDPPSSDSSSGTRCVLRLWARGLIMGIRRQIINASISLHYQIGRLVVGINVARKSNKNALNIFLSKPIILSRRCVNKTNVDTNTLLSRANSAGSITRFLKQLSWVAVATLSNYNTTLLCSTKLKLLISTLKAVSGNFSKMPSSNVIDFSENITEVGL